MLNKRFIIAFILALIALIVIGFIALNFVPTNDLIDLNGTALENVTDNATLNLTLDELNITANDTSADVNDTNQSSDIDPGDVLHKQTFTISENETGQNEGMEPGTYVMYYTGNDGIIKVEKIK